MREVNFQIHILSQIQDGDCLLFPSLLYQLHFNQSQRRPASIDQSFQNLYFFVHLRTPSPPLRSAVQTEVVLSRPAQCMHSTANVANIETEFSKLNKIFVFVKNCAQT